MNAPSQQYERSKLTMGRERERKKIRRERGNAIKLNKYKKQFISSQ